MHGITYGKKDDSQIHPLQIKLIEDLVENSLFEDKKIGRWRYTFNQFSDIISALETNQNGLFLDATRKSSIYRNYIKREISEIFKALVEKDKSTGEIKSIIEILPLPELELDMLNSSKINFNTASYLITFCTVISSKDTLLRKINRVFNYIAQGEFSRFNSIEEKYVLPEYIKLTVQTLEILEKIFDNAKHELYRKLRERPTRDFYINGFEYWMVTSLYDDLKLVITKLTVLMKCYHLNWYDIEKRPDSFYAYRGNAGENISDEELLKYAQSK